MYSILIPSYNEPNLKNLIAEIRKSYSFEIIVIDDGSHLPIEPIYTFSEVTVLRNRKNMGKGYSLLKGIKESERIGCKYSIALDADFQHDPKDILSFINDSRDADLILGYRDFKRPMPLSRILSNKITSSIVSFIVKKNIKDSQCGFRMYKNSIFKNMKFDEKGFQFESELLLKMASLIQINQVPIKTIYNNSSSHINGAKDTYKFIKLIIKHIIYGK